MAGKKEYGDGQNAVIKGVPVTSSEKKLYDLFSRTMLKLWSYPSVFNKPGNEMCDGLAVFREHVFIFSDKDCAWPCHDDLNISWSRWYKKSILDSAKQAWGAERWLKNHPDRVFLDAKCERSFPLRIPENPIFHIIIVTRNSTEHAKAFRESGQMGCLNYQDSAICAPSDVPKQPFTITDLDPRKTFVHVLDEVSVEILLQEQDTFSDLLRYLAAKEKLLRGTAQILSAREPDLLALYTRTFSEDAGYHFPIGDIQCLEDEWMALESHPDFIAKNESNLISYNWDRLIDNFASYGLDDRQYFATDPSLDATSCVLMEMAEEDRFSRRVLSRALADVVHMEYKNGGLRTRIVLSSNILDKAYVFCVLQPLPNEDPDEYRKKRSDSLFLKCLAAKCRFVNLRTVVGLGAEPRDGRDHFSEDALFLDVGNWGEVDFQKARAQLESTNFLAPEGQALKVVQASEYPKETDKTNR